jgi:tRNA threonylcarbamoyladenosine biosynthesis protein TsaE
MKQYISRSPEETKDIGYRLGRCLRPGDVIGIYGELGAGKTVLVKGIARAFGIRERDITSASFTIIARYETSPLFAHIDLYRIERPEELLEVGISDQIGSDGVTVIEWAEKAGGYLPDEAVGVYMRCTGNNGREITIEGLDEKDRGNIEDWLS